jgi:hypothetical protein
MTANASLARLSFEAVTRTPFNVVPAPSWAMNVSRVRGAWIAAARTLPSSTYAIATQ